MNIQINVDMKWKFPSRPHITKANFIKVCSGGMITFTFSFVIQGWSLLFPHIHLRFKSHWFSPHCLMSAYLFRIKFKDLLLCEGCSYSDGSARDWGGLKSTSVPPWRHESWFITYLLFIFSPVLAVSPFGFFWLYRSLNFIIPALQLSPPVFLHWRFSCTHTQDMVYNLVLLWCPTDDLCFVTHLPGLGIYFSSW